MKSFKWFLLSAAAVLFAAGACDKTTTDDPDNGGGDTTSSAITVEASVFEVNSGAQTLTVGYEVTDAVEGETLVASVDVDWLSAVVGDDAVTVTVAANDTGADRSAAVTLSYAGADDVSVWVYQLIPVINVASEVSVTSEAGSTDVSYSVSNPVDGEALTASVDVDWASIVVGDDAVTVTVSENTGDERTATVTLSYPYAADVTVSVVQEAAPDPDYLAFIGTWTVNDGSTTGTIVISQNVANESYTIDGWQFAETGMDATELGFNETGSIAFTATYDSDNKALVISAVNFGDYTMDYQGLDLAGSLWLMGIIDYNGSETPVTGTYTIATMTMTNETTAAMSGGSVSLSAGGTFDIIAAEYMYAITSPSSYSGYVLSWSDPAGTYFPSTLTKVSSGTASTSSVKSAEIAVPVMRNNSVKAL